MFIGKIGCYSIFGGVDDDGSQIFSLSSEGWANGFHYATLVSGSLAAMTVFESRWKSDMREKEGVDMVRNAISASWIRFQYLYLCDTQKLQQP